MKKTLIPMMLVATTLFTGCQANANVSNVSETTVAAVEETNSSYSDEQIEEMFIDIAETTPKVSVDLSGVIGETTETVTVSQPEETAEVAPTTTTKAAPTKAPATKPTSATTVATAATTEATSAMSNMAAILSNYPAYYELVMNVKNAVSTNSSSLSALSPSIKNYGEVNTGVNLGKAITVTLCDINNDGIPELFFTAKTYDGKGTLILDMYTLINNSAVKIISREYYESYAYSEGATIIHQDDSQIIDVLTFDGTSLQVTASYGPDDGFSYSKNSIPGTSSILSEI